MDAAYVKKLRTGYFKNLKDIDEETPFKPMLAADYNKVKFDFPVLTQPKLDGIRCIAFNGALWTRSGKEIVTCRKVLGLINKMAEKYPDAIFDGELYNHSLRDDFNTISSLVRKTKPTEEDQAECDEKIQYWIYDVDGLEDAVEDRNQLLHDMELESPLVFVPTETAFTQEDLDALYAEWLEAGFEGQMVRKPGSLYENKRSKNLLKRKEFLSEEFKVVSVEEGQGNWSGCVKRFILELSDGRTFGSGVRGTQSVLQELLSQDVPDWATCRFFTPTPDGIPRFPVVTDWGYGKRTD
jgi:DNA ligase 1